ncbi:MAG: hypothetical protein KJ718_00090 [Nanoarchaeota archaeon]|nr:hypothetical protein [Nanoarchaeota archaeon]MBU1050940.1 hypothetical protein [Nanoarchaeota archaeon]MBU1988217.1 hypothetical protein [Nanoarchaeota archaeon]
MGWPGRVSTTVELAGNEIAFISATPDKAPRRKRMDEAYTRADLKQDLETEDLRVTPEGIIRYRITGGRDRQERWHYIGCTTPPEKFFMDREENYNTRVESVTIEFLGYDAMKHINGAVELYETLTQLDKVPVRNMGLRRTINGLRRSARLLKRRNLTGQAEKRKTLAEKVTSSQP